jgi:hypothetical protein
VFFHRPFLIRVGCLLTALSLAGCASTNFKQYQAGEVRTVCQTAPGAMPAVVMWGTAWRTDQPKQGEREITAERGLRNFFAKNSCFRQAYVAGAVQGRSPLAMSDVEMIRWARAQPTVFGTLVQVRLEELDTRTDIRPSLVLWETSSQVQLRVRVLDMATMRLLTDKTIHWWNGGGYIIRGTGWLDDDLTAALEAVFAPAPTPATPAAKP